MILVATDLGLLRDTTRFRGRATIFNCHSLIVAIRPSCKNKNGFVLASEDAMENRPRFCTVGIGSACDSEIPRLRVKTAFPDQYPFVQAA